MTRLIKHLPSSKAFLLTIGLATIPVVSDRAQSEPKLRPILPSIAATDSATLRPAPAKQFDLWQFVKTNSPKLEAILLRRGFTNATERIGSAPTPADFLVFADRYSFTDRTAITLDRYISKDTKAFTFDRALPQSGIAAIVPANLDVLLFGDRYAFSSNVVGSAPIAKPAIPVAPVRTPPAVATNIPPRVAKIHLVLKLKERRVYVYHGQTVLTSYPVGIGRKGRETPTGEWQVMETIVNPGWTDFNTGRLMPPGKNNPMGTRWIGFWTDGEDMIGFHGTNKVASIGKAVSNGCVRMLDRDVQEMYKQIEVGTIVRVVNE